MKTSLAIIKFIFIFSVGIFSAILVGASGVALYLAPQLPSTHLLRDAQLQIPMRIFSNDGSLISEFGEKKRKPAKLEDMPEDLVQAFLSAEDANFYEHAGVDIKGLARAAKELAVGGRIKSGGSTITMQLARNFFLSKEKSFVRKFAEIILAIQIERELTKDEILELYLNKIFLGYRSYGVVAAAEVYYGRPLSELSLAEKATIAGLPKAPSSNNPISNPERAKERRNWIIRRMEALNFISAEEASEATSAPITAQYHKQESEISAPYFSELVRNELEKRFGKDAYTGGYRIYTTLDPHHHQAAKVALQSGLMAYTMRHGFRKPENFLSADAEYTDDDIINVLKPLDKIGPLEPGLVTEVRDDGITVTLKNLESVEVPWETMKWARRYVDVNSLGPEVAKPQDAVLRGYVVRVYPQQDGWALGQIPEAQGVLISMDPNTGAVNAAIGGFDFFENQFNRATQAKRQPGSNIKPFLYSAALANGYTPASTINDAPIVRKDSDIDEAWRPRNAGGNFFGPTRLRVALYKSRNLVSIRLLEALTAEAARQYLIKTFGFTDEELPKDLTLALGSGVLTPMKMAQAYAALSNGGYQVEPWFIERIEKANGEVVFQAPRVTKNAAECLATPELSSPSSDLLSLDNETASSTPTNEEVSTPPAKAPESNLATTSSPEDCLILTRTMDEKIHFLITNMMKDVITKGTAKAAKVLERRDLAGKTGTTNDQIDAWFSGFNSQIVSTVWVGFDQPQSLGRREYGGRAALPIWINYMGRVLPDIPEDPDVVPQGIVQVKIDPDTGLAARPAQQDAIFEYFDENNYPEPEEEEIYDEPTDSSEIGDPSVPAEALF